MKSMLKGGFVAALGASIALNAWFSYPAHAQETGAGHPILGAWYKALEEANVEKLEELMAPEAVQPFQYEITDLGISQSRSEFIDSMAEWVGAIDGGTITYKITASQASTVTTLVCYQFPDSNFLAEELVELRDQKIIGIKQAGKSDNCEAF